MVKRVFLFLLCTVMSLSSVLAEAETSSTSTQSTAHKEATSRQSEVPMLERPLMERYVLDELKSLRQDQQDLERRLTIQITDRELDVADKSMNYANVTVTYFFYIIAGVASLIALIGWHSLREVKVNTREMADKRLNKIALEYEKKFLALERDLKRKTRIITENNREIEIINEIHNLWLRAQSVQTPDQRVEVYDEILKIRPGDLEALTYKADAVMEIDEYHWALSLCNRVLELDENNGPALYQRACAYARLGAEDQAIEDLQRAVITSPSLKDAIMEESDFESLYGNKKFDVWLNGEDSENKTQ
ncbi:Tetratricopeptide repeat protein [Vibrio palustris]|uniref:Tetratricopeptide repeat protein n=2 Tax=Vibrio palustris TaxID=1918946 RepID=A0A1R4B6P2_9VIBR|nr:Tetratricopeptide repeat protein [Vibrio palustris]